MVIRRGGRHVAKRTTDPLITYPEVQIRVLQVVGIFAPFASRGGGEGRYPGKIRFIEPKMVNGHWRPVAVPPAAVRQGKAW